MRLNSRAQSIQNRAISTRFGVKSSLKLPFFVYIKNICVRPNIVLDARLNMASDAPKKHLYETSKYVTIGKRLKTICAIKGYKGKVYEKTAKRDNVDFSVCRGCRHGGGVFGENF